MARRNLYAEAQAQAQAQVAPQVAALGEALQQARADRNAAIHTAAATSRGQGRAINRAGPSLRKAYDTHLLAGPGQSYSSGAYGSAAANERAVTGTALASSLANSLKELSDRRIEAAAGRAYRTAAAEGNYQANVGKIQSKRQSLAAQEGLYAASALSKLTENAASRKQQRILEGMRENSTASLQSQSQAFTHHENAVGRKFTAGQTTAGQEFTAGQKAKDRANARDIAGMKVTPSGLTPNQIAKTNQAHQTQVTDPLDAVTAQIIAQKGRQTPHQIRQSLLSPSDKKTKPVPTALVNAAMDLAYNGYLSTPNKAVVGSMLKAHGVGQIPKRYLGVQVKAHTRKRRGG